jgi:hypothetical protein
MGLITTLVIGASVFWGGSKLLDALGTKKAGNNLISEFSTVKWKTPTGGCVNFDVKVKHTNPTSVALNIEKLNLNLSIAGYPVGKVSQANKQTIPANGSIRHTYRLKSEKWTGLLSTFFTILLMGDIPNKIKLNGSITANGFTTDISTNLPLKK